MQKHAEVIIYYDYLSVCKANLQLVADKIMKNPECSGINVRPTRLEQSAFLKNMLVRLPFLIYLGLLCYL